MSGDIFDGHHRQLEVGEGGCHWHLAGGGWDAAKRPTGHRTALQQKLSSPKCHSDRLGNPVREEEAKAQH